MAPGELARTHCATVGVGFRRKKGSRFKGGSRYLNYTEIL